MSMTNANQGAGAATAEPEKPAAPENDTPAAEAKEPIVRRRAKIEDVERLETEVVDLKAKLDEKSKQLKKCRRMLHRSLGESFVIEDLAEGVLGPA